MQMPTPTDAGRARFADLVPDAPDVEVKPMFGNLGAPGVGQLWRASTLSAVTTGCSEVLSDSGISRATLVGCPSTTGVSVRGAPR